MSAAKTFYTYLWLREDGTPYYVGKGHCKRAIRKGSPQDLTRILIQEHESEQDAFTAEMFLIAYYGRKDLGTGCLRNLTDGGEGGSNPSEETRRKMAAAQLGRHPSDEQLLRMSVITKQLWASGAFGDTNLAGQTFGRLTVLSLSEERTTQRANRWLCECICGIQVVVSSTQLRNGNTQSCGCLQTDKVREILLKRNKSPEQRLAVAEASRIRLRGVKPAGDGNHRLGHSVSAETRHKISQANTKTHCRRGHLRCPENLTTDRGCRECARERASAYYYAHRAKENQCQLQQ
jgi:hypothetical protein